jgi:hypothetical protein
MVIRGEERSGIGGNSSVPKRVESESVTDALALVVWKNKIDCVDWSTCGGFVVDG